MFVVEESLYVVRFYSNVTERSIIVDRPKKESMQHFLSVCLVSTNWRWSREVAQVFSFVFRRAIQIRSLKARLVTVKSRKAIILCCWTVGFPIADLL